MKHEDEPLNDYNKRMKEYITDLVKQEIIALGETKKKDSRGTVRDYKKEYAKYGSSTKAKKYRAELNKYNRKKGTYGNGDGKDASHKGGKIVGFESQSKNRGRAEKSRLKKEVHESIQDRMKDIMIRLSKSLRLKSVVSMHTGTGSFSYFMDDEKEAKKLAQMLKKHLKRVRIINLDKSKGDTANFVVAADMFGLESVNESEQDKIKQFLMKKGDNEKDATEKLKYYDMVSKMYKGANSTKKAEIMSSLWANEAVNNPSFFDSFSITEVRKMSDRELKDYLLYMKKYKPDVWNHMKKNKDLKKMIRKLRVESVNESYTSNMMRAVRKGGTAGPWDIIVSKNNKIVKRVSVKNLKEIPAEMDDVKKKFRNHKIGIESKYGKIVYRESIQEGVSKSQAQEIMNQLGGRKFEMLMGVKSKGIGKDGLILHIGKNPKRVSHIIIDLDRGKDLYNLTFGKIYKYQFKIVKKLKGIYVDQLHDMIEKYTGNLTTFRPRR